MSFINNELSYKVKDIALAEFGRKEIEIAEKEMPGLLSIRKKHSRYKASQRCQGHRLTAHDNTDGCSHRDTA